VTATQVTLFQLDNYGPWTVTPEPRPEAELQALQARLYADLAEAVGDRGGVVFFARFDNVVAVTNGLDRADHRAILDALDERYPVSVSAAVGVHERPASALASASEALQAAGSAQDAARAGVLVGEWLGGEHSAADRAGPAADGTTDAAAADGTIDAAAGPVVDPAADEADASGRRGTVHVAHFDLVDATGRLTDRLDAYGAHLRVQAATHALSEHLYAEHDALAFFVGGDNVIAVCPELPASAYERAIDHVADATDGAFQVGVGEGETAREAGMAAKYALEACRREGSRIEGLATPTAD